MIDHKCTKEKVFTEIFVAQGAIQKDVSYIRKILEDNGAPGLITKSNIAHDYIISQKQKEESETKIESWSRRKLLFWLGIIFGLPGTALIVLQIIIILKIYGG